MAKGTRAAPKTSAPRRRSARATETSDAMDVGAGTFKSTDPKRIARSLKTSAETSDRRKAAPYRSAVSMLTFYINRTNHNLPAAQLKILEKAKADLAKPFGREPPAANAKSPKTPKKAEPSKKAAASGNPRSSSRPKRT